MVVGIDAVVTLGWRKGALTVHDVVVEQSLVVVHMYDEQSTLRRVCVPSPVLVVLQQIELVAVIVVVYGVSLALIVFKVFHPGYDIAGFQLFYVKPSCICALIACPSCRTPTYTIRSIVAAACQQIPVAHSRCVAVVRVIHVGKPHTV